MIRKLNIALAIAAAALSLYVVIAPVSPTASIGHFATDHYSHYSAAILFWHRGIAIYSTPIRLLCAPTTPTSRAFGEELGLEPTAICDLPERNGERPLVMSWSMFPRPYPPGSVLYAAPEAVLYAHTGLSVRTINRISIIKHILVGHLLVAVLLGFLFGGPDDDDRRRWRTAAFFLAPLVYFIVVPYAMAGFYDPASILCVCWAIRRLDQERPLDAFALLSLAAFLHFRAIWYAPLGVIAFVRLRGQTELLRTRRGIALLAVSGAMLIASAVSLVLVSPYLSMFPHSNPMLFANLSDATPAQVDYVAAIVVVAGYLAWERQWILLATLTWTELVIGLSVQTQQWHPMFLLPLFVVARWQRARAPAVIAIVVMVIAITRLVYNMTPTPGVFLSALFGVRI